MKLIIRYCLIALMCFGIVGCASEKEEVKEQIVRPVKTMVIGSSGETSYVYPGVVKASQQVDLSFRVAGPLVKFPINEGDEINKGQLLAQIDQRDFKIAFSKAQAELVKAKADYGRMDTLYKSNAISKAELDDKKSTYEVAQSNFDKAKADLDDTELKAPYAGRIGKTMVENYQDVQVKQPILSLLDVSAVEIEIDVPENIIVTTRKEDTKKFIASFDSLPGRTFELVLKEFTTQADAATQTYRITFVMEAPKDVKILPGMSAEVHVYITSLGKKDIKKIIVPSKAVAADDAGQSFVWKVDMDSLVVNKQAVSVGKITGESDIEVLSGIKLGERIATAGISLLKEGMKIKLME